MSVKQSGDRRKILDIYCEAPDPPELLVIKKEKIKIKNRTGEKVEIKFTNPEIFSPPVQNPLIISDNKLVKLTIGDIGSGTGYEYPGCGSAAGPRNGRIDPV